MNAITRLLPSQSRLASIEPTTFNPETREIEVVWTQGAVVRRYNFWDDEFYDEELVVDEGAVDMSRLASGNAPVVDSHRTLGLANQLGVVARAWLDKGRGHAVIRLSGRPELAGIVQDIRDGIIRNISVGYSVQRYEITREANKPPLYRATAWQPMELSFVSVPADADATVRSADTQGAPCVFVRARAPNNPEEMQMSDNAPAAAAADPAVEVETARGAPANAPATETVVTQATDTPADTNARAAEIVELATRHGMADKAAAWIREGKSPDQVRAQVLDALAARSDEVATTVNRTSVMPGQDVADKQRSAAEEMLLARAFCTDEKGQRIVMARDNPFRGSTLLDLARGSLQRAGVRTDGMSKLDLVGRAFTQTSSDFPVLLESAMHKALQAAYAVAPDTWSRWCARGSVSDFREHNRYRVGSLGNLDALTEAGEFRNKTIPDGERARISAGTKGNIINLTRKAIINDDLGAFIGLANQLGRAARRSVEADAYAMLVANPVMADGFALFSTEHANLGTSGVPTVVAFDEARSLMAKQKDISGNDFLDLRPSIWLGPVSLGGTARVINDAQYDPDTANKLQRPNMVRGLVSDVVDSPRLSGNGWYMLASPGEAPVIEVAFLDGQDTPFLDSEEGFDVDGVRWKVRLDYGLAVIDYRGAVYNAGAGG